MYQTKEVIRIRYRIGDKKEFILQDGVKKVKQITQVYSRPYNAEKLTFEDGSIKWFKIQESKKKRSRKEINPDNFITEWKGGPTPTPKPTHKYNDEALKERGYSTEQIKEVRKNSWKNNTSSKTLSKIWKKYRNADGIRIPRQSVAALMQEGVIKAEDFYTTNLQKKEAKVQHNNAGALRARKAKRKVTRNKKKQSKTAKKLAKRGDKRKKN